MSDTLNPERAAEHPAADSTKLDGGEGPKIPGLQLIAIKDETSTAIIWNALQVSLDREVSVWMMKEEFAQKASQAAHFEAVSRAVSRIRHPNLVQVIDVARTPDGTPYVVFENIDGAMLGSLLWAERKFDSMRALRIAIEIGNALDFAWKQCGFVHRNIKPETILVGTGDTVKLTNFSSATLVKPGQNPLASDEELVVGTPNYASPEQIDCLRSIDFHSDMYSTGALLYRMITGITPFGDEDDPMVVFDRQRIGTLKNPRDIDPKIKPGVVHIIQKMMAKAPENRYTWWQDAIEDMHRVLEGRPPYIQAGNYVPPPSTIAASLAEEPFNERVSRSFKLPKKTTSSSSNGARPSSATAYAPRNRTSGPSAFVRMMVVFLLVGFCFWLVPVRLRDLERVRSAESSQESITPVGDFDASFGNADDQGTPLQDERTLATNDADADAFDSGEDDSGEASPMAVQGSQSEPAGDAHVAATEEAGEKRTATPGLSQAELVETLYRTVVKFPLDEARDRARSLFQESKGVHGLDEEACKLMWRAFSEASSYEDLVGVFLAGSPGKRTISVAGEELEVTPRMYSNGELIGMLHLKDGTSQAGHRIQLSDMSDAEMYDCLQAAVVDTTRSALFGRAFLTMKMKDRGAFSLFVVKYELKELEPFLDIIGK